MSGVYGKYPYFTSELILKNLSSKEDSSRTPVDHRLRYCLGWTGGMWEGFPCPQLLPSVQEGIQRVQRVQSVQCWLDGPKIEGKMFSLVDDRRDFINFRLKLAKTRESSEFNWTFNVFFLLTVRTGVLVGWPSPFLRDTSGLSYQPPMAPQQDVNPKPTLPIYKYVLLDVLKKEF